MEEKWEGILRVMGGGHVFTQEFDDKGGGEG